MKKQNIFITTTENIVGEEIEENLGLVRGNTIRARHIGSDIGASLKSIIGGEIKGYVKALSDAREQAIERMVEEAKSKETDAIVNVRFATSQVMKASAEILVYGTAVKLKK